MAKGGYLGGHTVVGPHTPEWFSKDGEAAPGDATPPAKTERKGVPSGKTNRHQRRKIANARAKGDVLAGRLVRVEPLQLTLAVEGRIATLRRDVKIHASEVKAARVRLDQAKDELRNLLTRYALPLDEGL